MSSKRLAVGTVLGALLGVICILGVSQRLPSEPIPDETVYLVNAWFQRLIMGVLVGLAGGLRLVGKLDGAANAAARGVLCGALTSVPFAFFGQEVTVPYFIAGLGFGLVCDLFTTLVCRRGKNQFTP